MSPQPPGWSGPSNENRAEDLAFMAATGETVTGAAARLGISFSALEMWTRRHAPHLWERLINNERRDGHVRGGKVTVRSL